MAPPRFAVGDRVRLRVRKSGWRAALSGTIQRVYHSLDDTYEVLFDGAPTSQMVRGRVLERIAEEEDQPPHD
jgi:hypothetical protein